MKGQLQIQVHDKSMRKYLIQREIWTDPKIRRNRLDQLWNCIQSHGKEQTDGNHKGRSQPMAHQYETQSIL
jgi:hypothetical protein